MCGRYNLTDSPLVQALLAELGIDFDIEPRFNIAPTEQIPVILNQDGAHCVLPMRWWLVPRWSKGPSTEYSMFNARRESLRSSRAYSQPFKRQRAIIPASSFIEWQRHGGGKTPILLESTERPLAFAGVWEYWDSAEGMLLSCSIITLQAPEAFTAIHHRMPLILLPEEYQDWLNPNTESERVTQMLDRDNRLIIEATPLSNRVNNSRNKEPECLEVVGDSWELNLD